MPNKSGFGFNLNVFFLSRSGKRWTSSTFWQRTSTNTTTPQKVGKIGAMRGWCFSTGATKNWQQKKRDAVTKCFQAKAHMAFRGDLFCGALVGGKESSSCFGSHCFFPNTPPSSMWELFKNKHYRLLLRFFRKPTSWPMLCGEFQLECSSKNCKTTTAM